jgi:hypothetical protein
MKSSSSIAMEVERLTHMAGEAAAQGRWDLVGACYREREAAISQAALSSQQIEQLLAVDRQVHDRAVLAKAVLGRLLGQSSSVGRRLKELRRGSGASQPARTIRLEA